MRRPSLVLLLLAPGVLVGLAIALSPDPTGPWRSPLGQRLLYVHVPLAWTAYVAFAVSTGAAIATLSRSDPAAGGLLRASNELAAVLATLALATGLAWSYEFTFDPLSDPKVVSTVVLVAVLAGLWALAATTPPPRRDSLVAALTVAGALSVPASYFASRLSVHPDFTTGEGSLDPGMGGLLVLASLGVASLYVGLLDLRRRALALEEGR